MKKMTTAAMSIGTTTPTAIPAVAPVDSPEEPDFVELDIDVDLASTVSVSVCPFVVVM